ncbi:unnamed protein product [Onchocerca flexuosa]|uniref:Uncharacterized protein n=1 Tax=Onchocerca flexuosa TaxID=387005 RepID=A0A183HIY3_9BILA|nr:unnamed protein product [Onchocerca flexuosa]
MTLLGVTKDNDYFHASQEMTMKYYRSTKIFILQIERGNTTVFKHNDVTIKYKLDNEFELVFTMK